MLIWVRKLGPLRDGACPSHSSGRRRWDLNRVSPVQSCPHHVGPGAVGGILSPHWLHLQGEAGLRAQARACPLFRAESLGQLVVGGFCFSLGFPLPHPGLNETIPG